MALVTNPTMDQLRRLKSQNLATLFANKKVEGVGIGPQTENSQTQILVDIETTGANTIVIVMRPLPVFIPPFTELSGTDADGTPISIVPSYVATGLFNDKVAIISITRGLLGVPRPKDLDQVQPRPDDPTSPSAQLLVKDDRERKQLIAGASLGISYKKTLYDTNLTDASITPSKRKSAQVGTLGCIAETDTGKLVLLTCHHVVISPTDVCTTTRNAANKEVSGNVVAGDYRVTKRNDDYILQVRTPGNASFVDAPTKRSWQLKNGARSDKFVVGQPTPGNCCGCERDEIGRLYRSTYTPQVDAAAVLLNESQAQSCILPLSLGGDDLTDWRAEVTGKGGAEDTTKTLEVRGAIAADLTLADLQESFTKPDGTTSHRLRYVVRKYGYKTGFTSGLVRCIEYTMNSTQPSTTKVPELLDDEETPGNGARDLVDITDLVIDDRLYVIPYDEDKKEVAALFGASGDSGAAVVNTAGLVVGLATTGLDWDESPPDPVNEPEINFDNITVGWGAAVSKISSIMESLKVTVKPFQISQRVRTVPAGNQSLLGDSSENASGAVRQRLLGSPLVRRTGRLFPKLSHLVNHNRRVTVAWHKNHGPSIALSAIAALKDPTKRVVEEVNGRSSRDCMVSLLEELKSACTPELRSELDELTPWLLRMPGTTAEEYAAILEGMSCQ